MIWKELNLYVQIGLAGEHLLNLKIMTKHVYTIEAFGNLLHITYNNKSQININNIRVTGLKPGLVANKGGIQTAALSVSITEY